MGKFWEKLAIFFGSSAIGILVAALTVPRFHLTFLGFIAAVIVFTVAQAIISPLLSFFVEKYASTLTGMVGLISTFLSLWIATLFAGGLRIEGVLAWVLSTLVVWIVTLFATILLPRAFSSGTKSAD